MKMTTTTAHGKKILRSFLLTAEEVPVKVLMFQILMVPQLLAPTERLQPHLLGNSTAATLNQLISSKQDL